MWRRDSPLLDQPLPAITPLSRVRAEFGEAAGTLEQKPPKDYNRVARELSDLLAAGGNLSRRQLKDAAWCMWSTAPALATTAVLEPLLLQIGDADGPRPFRTLASSFMLSFHTGMAGQSETAFALAALSKRWGKPWSLLQERFQLFDLREGPRRLAAAVIAEDRAAPDILKDAGLGAVSAQSGYAKAVTASLLDMLAEGGEPDHLRRLARIKKYGLSEAGNALYHELMPKLIEALLRPFEQVDPDKAIQERFLEVVLRLLGGDPRLPGGNWANMPIGLRSVLERWLTEQSLLQFLEIVGKTAVPHMWRHRRAFWEAALKAGLVQNAWVAFGAKGDTIASTSYRGRASYAKLRKGGKKNVEPGHAVLLMHIGSGVVADWSHNGKCNVWSDRQFHGARHV